MKSTLLAVVWTIASTATAFAATPNITAVLDAGGYTANVAPGTVFVIKGTNLCTTTISANISVAPYSQSAMGGTTILFTPVAGGTGINAYMIYTYDSGGITQLAGELPSTTPAGNYNVTVTTSGATSAPFVATVTTTKVGLMTQAGSGSGRALLQNVVSASQYDLNGFTTGPVPGANFQRSPAYPTEFLIAWAVGLGAATGFDATAPGNGLNFLSTENLNVTVLVGGTTITPTYAGRSNLFPGLDNIIFQLPAGITTGCNINFQVNVAGQLSNVTTISIATAANAGACVSPQYSQATLSKLDSGGSITAGYFDLSSSSSTISFQGQTLTSLSESAGGSFTQYNADSITQIPNLSTPPSTGACTVYRVTSTSSSGNPAGTPATALDAGVVTLNGPNVANKALPANNNTYFLNLGNPLPGSPAVIVPGAYTLSGAGGKDIGPFSTNLTIGPTLTVTGGLPAAITRSQNLTISWTGGGTSLVTISGLAYVLVSGSAANNNAVYDSGFFLCVTTADKLSFTVPSSILSQLPATPAAAVTAGNAFGSLSVNTGTIPSSGNGLFSAPLVAGGNTDYAYFTSTIGVTGTPMYQ